MSQSRTHHGRHERRIWGWGGVADHAEIAAAARESIRAHQGYCGKHRAER